MENLSRDSVENIASYLPGIDRLSLALCSKSSFEAVRRKLEFKVLAREQPEVVRIRHKRGGPGPGRENFVKWLISGNGEVVVVVDWNFEKREIVVDRIGIPENEVSSRLLIQSGGYGGHFSAELSYSGTILATVGMDYYSEQRDLFDLNICRLTSSNIHVIAGHMLNEATAEIVFSRSEKYIAVTSRTKVLILNSSGEILYTRNDSTWINLTAGFTKREELLLFSNNGSRGTLRESSAYEMRMSSPPFDSLVRLPNIPGTEQGPCRARLSSEGMLIVYYDKRQLFEVFEVNAGSSGYRSCLRSFIDSNIRISPFMPNLFISYEVGDKLGGGYLYWS
uniref:F-box domain-containing protein n=1 Tax=Rhodosorus marinus TaxID=101924 RepID=A0A7S0BEQ7_9RHOD|mmetsp:Transcript_12992/g.18685  ORF Transcript_12992/g.18685 Transcript_12992/m.18685 type:complete len:336 (+) Transcript_12992:523-1530(+)